MYNKMTKEGLFKIREGIDLLINALNEEQNNMAETNAAEEVSERKVVTPTAPKRDVTAVSKKETAHFDKEDLDSMAYNDLKKLAKELGVSGAGAREAIIERILGVDVNVTEDGEAEVSEDSTAVEEKAPKSKGIKKLGKKSEDEDSEEPTPEEDPVYAKVLEVTEDMSIEDLGEILSDIGISPKGKRQALIDKIYSAVQNGDLSLDDEGEEDNEEDVEDTNSEVEDEADDEVDDDGVNDPDNMTDARKEACEQYAEEIKNDFENGDLKAKDIKEFLVEFYGEENKDEILDLSDEDLIDLYIDAVQRMIDDEGELVEEGAYVVNGEYFCCGRKLQYAEDTNKYICEMCGEEYDAE